MARFYNCSDNYLWKKGIAPILNLFYIGFIVYLVIIIVHKPIVDIKNTTLTLTWAIFTLFLLFFWKKQLNKTDKIIKNYTLGFIGEWRVRQKLNKLSNNFFVLYDVRISKMEGNIDYVIICDFGIFALEVKTLNYLSREIYQENKKQSINQAVRLQKFLSSKEILKNIFVCPVLVYSNIDFKQHYDNRVEVLGKNDIKVYFMKNMPKRENEKYKKGEIDKIVFTIVNYCKK